MVREWVRRGAVVMAMLLPVCILGCASTYYDPLPPPEASARDVRPVRGRSLETVYRQLYARLDECYSASYHVQPRFERTHGEAWIMLVSGLGLNRYSLIGNSFAARIDMRAQRASVEVRVTHRGDELADLAARIERWLDGATGCRV